MGLSSCNAGQNKDRMVHIYAAQYFLVTSYWRCPTDRVWSKFLSLIHPAIIKELSRKDFGLALQTIILFPILSKSGGVAQMVERSLSMREVPGSIPGASIPHFKLILDSYILSIKVGSIFTHKLFVSI